MSFRSLCVVLALCLACGSDKESAKDSRGHDASADGPDAKLLRATGEPCAGGQECRGGLCLTKIENAQPPVPQFAGGYCSADCTTNPCGAGEQCTSFMSGYGAKVGSYCLQTCTSGAGTTGCRSGYVCTTGGLCYPAI